MSEKTTILTSEGLKKLKEELDNLISVKRKEVAEKIKEARAQGDLSENAEYDAAKDEQAEMENRIALLQKMINSAEIIDTTKLDNNIVGVGSRVKILDVQYDEEIEYQIVGSTEADPINGAISNDSPLGAALLGKYLDDIVKVDAPDGTIEYKILEIA